MGVSPPIFIAQNDAAQAKSNMLLAVHTIRFWMGHLGDGIGSEKSLLVVSAHGPGPKETLSLQILLLA